MTGYDGLFLLIGYTSSLLLVLIGGYVILRFVLGPEPRPRCDVCGRPLDDHPQAHR